MVQAVYRVERVEGRFKAFADFSGFYKADSAHHLERALNDSIRPRGLWVRTSLKARWMRMSRER